MSLSRKALLVKSTLYRSTLLCVLLYALCMIAVRPVAEKGLVDDWSYVLSAKALAATGHLVYNGGATAMLGWQLYLAAAFIKVLGFSWTVTRLSVMVTVLVGLGLYQRTLLRMGCSERDASLIALGTVCTSNFLFCATTFMSDAPGWFALVVCLYLCVRALQASSDRAAGLWLVVASLTNAGLGTVRQVAWLGVLLMVPAVLWHLRKRREVLLYGVPGCFVGIALMGLALRWWAHVPYALHERTFFFHSTQVFETGMTMLAAFAFAAPLFTAMLAGRRRWWPVGLGAVLGVVVRCTQPWTGTPFGAGLLSPDAFGTGLVLSSAICALIFATGFAFLDSVWTVLREMRPEQPKQEDVLLADAPALFWLLVPYSLGFLLLLVTRATMWPRYWLMFVPVLGVLTVWVFRRLHPGQQLPGICTAAVTLALISGVISIHDVFSSARSEVTAVQEYLAAGYSRGQLEAGFEDDGAYEIDVRGYVNDARISVPHRIYFKPAQTLPAACLKPVWDLSPSIDRRYALASEYGGCFQPMGLAPVPYRTWYAPFVRQTVIAKITPEALAQR